MKHKRINIGLLFGLVLFAAGCAQVPKEAGFNDVKGLVGERVDYNLHWNQQTEADREVEKAIEALIKNELTIPWSNLSKDLRNFR